MYKTLVCAATAIACTISLSANLPARSQPAPHPTAAPASTMAELPTLRKGMTGIAVKLLQDILVSHQLLSPSDVTWYFGDKTEQAVRQFQRRYNLPVDAVVGPATWRMLGGTLWD